MWLALLLSIFMLIDVGWADSIESTRQADGDAVSWVDDCAARIAAATTRSCALDMPPGFNPTSDGTLLWASCLAAGGLSTQNVSILLLNHTVYMFGGAYQPSQLIQEYAAVAQVPLDLTVVEPDFWDAGFMQLAGGGPAWVTSGQGSGADSSSSGSSSSSVGQDGSGGAGGGVGAAAEGEGATEEPGQSSSNGVGDGASTGDPLGGSSGPAAGNGNLRPRNISEYAGWALTPAMLGLLYEELGQLLQPLDELLAVRTSIPASAASPNHTASATVTARRRPAVTPQAAAPGGTGLPPTVAGASAVPELGGQQETGAVGNGVSALHTLLMDVPSIFRDVAAVYDGRLVGVPYSTEAPLLFYRRDLLDMLNLTAPATWTETIALARQLHRQEVPCPHNASSECRLVAHGFCFGLPNGCYYEGMALAAIWASLVGSLGTRMGIYYDPVTMQPLFTGPAMAEALLIYRTLVELGPPPPPPDPAYPCTRWDQETYLTQCAMGFSLTTLFKTVSFLFDGALRGKLGTTMLPGSPVALNRATGELQPCTPDLCPFALPADVSPLVSDPLQLLIKLPRPPPPPTPPPPSPFPSPSAPLEYPGDLVLGSLPPNLTAPDPLKLNSSASLPSSAPVPFLYSTGLPPDANAISPPAYTSTGTTTISPPAYTSTGTATTSPPAYTSTGTASPVARRLASSSTPAAQPLLINRVPYFGRGAFTLAANRLVAPNHALAALRSFTFALTYQDGWPLALDPTTRTSPVRNTHLSPDNIGVWVAAGYDREDTLAFLLSIQASLAHPCLAMGLRVRGATELAQAFSDAAVAVVAGTPPEQLLKALDDANKAMLAMHYGGNASTLQGAYWRDINYMRTSRPPPQPSPNSGGGGLGSSSGGAGDESLSRGGVVGVTVAAAGLGLGTLVGLVAWLLWGSGKRRRRQGLGQPVAAPGYSLDTSLCITDVQDSTLLWELLEESVMDVALSMHNAAIRGLLPRHGGYECHTEGDSFIIAFPTAASAVAFALEVQTVLMELPWPEALLELDSCSVVWHRGDKPHSGPSDPHLPSGTSKSAADVLTGLMSVSTQGGPSGISTHPHALSAASLGTLGQCPDPDPQEPPPAAAVLTTSGTSRAPDSWAEAMHPATEGGYAGGDALGMGSMDSPRMPVSGGGSGPQVGEMALALSAGGGVGGAEVQMIRSTAAQALRRGTRSSRLSVSGHAGRDRPSAPASQHQNQHQQPARGSLGSTAAAGLGTGGVAGGQPAHGANADTMLGGELNSVSANALPTPFTHLPPGLEAAGDSTPPTGTNATATVSGLRLSATGLVEAGMPVPREQQQRQQHAMRTSLQGPVQVRDALATNTGEAQPMPMRQHHSEQLPRPLQPSGAVLPPPPRPLRLPSPQPSSSQNGFGEVEAKALQALGKRQSGNGFVLPVRRTTHRRSQSNAHLSDMEGGTPSGPGTPSERTSLGFGAARMLSELRESIAGRYRRHAATSTVLDVDYEDSPRPPRRSQGNSASQQHRGRHTHSMWRSHRDLSRGITRQQQQQQLQTNGAFSHSSQTWLEEFGGGGGGGVIRPAPCVGSPASREGTSTPALSPQPSVTYGSLSQAGSPSLRPVGSQPLPKVLQPPVGEPTRNSDPQRYRPAGPRLPPRPPNVVANPIASVIGLPPRLPSASLPMGRVGAKGAAAPTAYLGPYSGTAMSIGGRPRHSYAGGGDLRRNATAKSMMRSTGGMQLPPSHAATLAGPGGAAGVEGRSPPERFRTPSLGSGPPRVADNQHVAQPPIGLRDSPAVTGRARSFQGPDGGNAQSPVRGSGGGSDGSGSGGNAYAYKPHGSLVVPALQVLPGDAAVPPPSAGGATPLAHRPSPLPSPQTSPEAVQLPRRSWSQLEGGLGTGPGSKPLSTADGRAVSIAVSAAAMQPPLLRGTSGPLSGGRSSRAHRQLIEGLLPNVPEAEEQPSSLEFTEPPTLHASGFLRVSMDAYMITAGGEVATGRRTSGGGGEVSGPLPPPLSGRLPRHGSSDPIVSAVSPFDVLVEEEDGPESLSGSTGQGGRGARGSVNTLRASVRGSAGGAASARFQFGLTREELEEDGGEGPGGAAAELRVLTRGVCGANVHTGEVESSFRPFDMYPVRDGTGLDDVLAAAAEASPAEAGVGQVKFQRGTTSACEISAVDAEPVRQGAESTTAPLQAHQHPQLPQLQHGLPPLMPSQDGPASVSIDIYDSLATYQSSSALTVTSRAKAAAAASTPRAPHSVHTSVPHPPTFSLSPLGRPTTSFPAATTTAPQRAGTHRSGSFLGRAPRAQAVPLKVSLGASFLDPATRTPSAAGGPKAGNWLQHKAQSMSIVAAGTSPASSFLTAGSPGPALAPENTLIDSGVDRGDDARISSMPPALARPSPGALTACSGGHTLRGKGQPLAVSAASQLSRLPGLKWMLAALGVPSGSHHAASAATCPGAISTPPAAAGASSLTAMPGLHPSSLAALMSALRSYSSNVRAGSGTARAGAIGGRLYGGPHGSHLSTPKGRYQPSATFLASGGAVQGVGVPSSSGWPDGFSATEPGAQGRASLCFRGMRVRVGVVSGLLEGRDLVHRKATSSRRMAYSGVCMRLTKLVSDAAVGGMVLLSGSTVERLLPLPRKDLPGVVLWHKGRYELLADKGEEDGAVEVIDLYQVISGPLAARQLVLEQLPLRGVRRQLLPGLLSAPVGPAVALAMVQVVGLPVLREWNPSVAGRSLALLHEAAMELLAAHGGYAAACEEGTLLAAFPAVAPAVCWLLSLEEHLRDHVAWPEELLGHELGDELVVSVPQPVHTHPANPHGVPLHLHSNGVVIGDAAGGTASWLASPSLGDVSLGTMGVAGADRAGSADRAEETQGWAAGLAGVLTSRRGRLSRKVSESGLGPAELHSGGPGQQQQQEQQQQGKRQGQLGRTRTSFMPRMGQRRMFRRSTSDRLSGGLARPPGVPDPRASAAYEIAPGVGLSLATAGGENSHPRGITLQQRAALSIEGVSGGFVRAMGGADAPPCELPVASGDSTEMCDGRHTAPPASCNLRSQLPPPQLQQQPAHASRRAQQQPSPLQRLVQSSRRLGFGGTQPLPKLTPLQPSAAELPGAGAAAETGGQLDPGQGHGSLQMRRGVSSNELFIRVEEVVVGGSSDAGAETCRAGASPQAAVEEGGRERASLGLSKGLSPRSGLVPTEEQWQQRHSEAVLPAVGASPRGRGGRGRTGRPGVLAQRAHRALRQGLGLGPGRVGAEGSGVADAREALPAPGIQAAPGAGPSDAAESSCSESAPLPPLGPGTANRRAAARRGSPQCRALPPPAPAPAPAPGPPTLQLSSPGDSLRAHTPSDAVSAPLCPANAAANGATTPVLFLPPSHVPSPNIAPLVLTRRGASQPLPQLPYGSLAGLPYDTSAPLPYVMVQQRVLRGLRVRAAVEVGNFWHDGSPSADRLYRTCNGGRAYGRLQRLCLQALMGQVLCSGHVAKRVHRAAVSGDAAARQLRLMPLPTGGGSSKRGATAGAAGRGGTGAGEGAEELGAGEAEVRAAAAAAAAAASATWIGTEGGGVEEELGSVAVRKEGKRRSVEVGGLPVVAGKADVWVCAWGPGRAGGGVGFASWGDPAV